MSTESIPNKISQKFDDIQIIQKFCSKKNRVFEIEADRQRYVLKLYSEQQKEGLLPEVSVLSCINQHLVPNIFAFDDKESFLLLEKILGENLCDELNSKSSEFNDKAKLTSCLADWFAKFHKNFSITGCSTVIRGDSILRNFVVLNKTIIGLDFEEARQANPWEDVGEICASILDTDPMFTDEKIKLVKIFLKTYENQVLWKCDEDISNLIIKYLQNHLRFRKEDTAKKMNDFTNTIIDRSLFCKQP